MTSGPSGTGRPASARHEIDPDALYHLATPEEWDRYGRQGCVAPASLDDEGFVHCSWGRQLPGTLARHFAGVTELLALRIDPAQLGGLRLVEEDSYGSGQAFPHVYGALPTDTVVDVVPVAGPA